MTIETRTLIELTDISGVEFECPHCKAKTLYPFENQCDRLAENCPNCNEAWFLNPNPKHPSEPTTAEGVKKTISSLRKLGENQLIRARVRLAIRGIPT